VRRPNPRYLHSPDDQPVRPPQQRQRQQQSASHHVSNTTARPTTTAAATSSNTGVRFPPTSKAAFNDIARQDGIADEYEDDDSDQQSSVVSFDYSDSSLESAQSVLLRDGIAGDLMQVQLPLNDAQSLAELQISLRNAANGIVPEKSLHLHQSIISRQNKFVAELCDNDKYKLKQCNTCKEVHFGSVKLRGPREMRQLKCERCHKDILRGKPLRFHHANEMDPFHPPNYEAKNQYEALAPLGEIEQMLIALHQPVMKVYRLKSGGFVFHGNVLNLVQNLDTMLLQLPRTLASVAIITVRRQTGLDPGEYKDFKVNKNNIMAWLTFLKAHNRYYRDIAIDQANVDALPDNAQDVYSQLRSVHIPDDVVQDDNIQAAVTTQLSQASAQHIVHTGGGIDAGPVLEEHEMLDNILTTGVSGPIPLLDEANDISRRVIDGVHRPVQGPIPLDEYRTPGLVAKTFPCLFPFGNADPFEQGRLHSVTLKEYLEHFCRYAIFDEIRGAFRRPFDANPRFMHYLQDLDERHRIISQAQFYIRNNPADAGRALIEFDRMDHQSIQEMHGRISKYSANICGSNSYLSAKRNELQSLIEQKGNATLWLTLSYADFHWKDVRQLFGQPPHGLDERETIKWANAQINMNPGLMDEYFQVRVDSFIKNFFGIGGLEHEWFWYRFEWQGRGAIHVHGMVRLKCDPGLVRLSKLVILGRKFERLMAAMEDVQSIPPTTMHTEAFKLNYPNDEYIEKDINVLAAQTTALLTRVNIDTVRQRIEEGHAAAVQIVTFRDFLLTNMNTSTPQNMPTDSTKVIRDPRPVDNPHPSSICHTVIDGHSIVNPDMMQYNRLANCVMRHQCVATYCIRKDKCRFNFPRPIQERTSLRLIEKKYSSSHSTSAGSLRTTAIEIFPATNDRWLNGHCRAALEAWGGNCDFTLLIDQDVTINYVAKYGTKVEENSTEFHHVFNQILRRGRERESEGKAILRSLFVRTNAGREKTQQETSHLAISAPIVRCSVFFKAVNLYNNRKRIILDGDDEEQPPDGEDDLPLPQQGEFGGEIRTEKSLVDFYSKRMDFRLWNEDLWAFYNTPDGLPSLQNMTFIEFCSKFRIAKRPKVIQRQENECVIVFTPDYRSNKSTQSYPMYCYFNLVKYKPWIDFPESLYPSGTRGNFEAELKTEQCIASVKDAWEAFLSNFDETADNVPGFIQGRIDQLRDRNERDEWTPVDDFDEEFQLEQGTEADDLLAICRTALLGDHHVNMGSQAESEWDSTHNWQETEKTYDGIDYNLRDNKGMERVYKSVIDQAGPIVQNANIREIAPQDLRGKQRIAFAMASYFIDNPTLPTKGMILCGAAGCGKSFVVDALRYKYPGQILVMAPSGKAASTIGGCTLHKGLHIKVKGRFQDLSNETMHEVRDVTFNGVKALIIDEFTKTRLKLLEKINRRCKQVMTNNEFFGGLAVILVGDPGQLPPVSGYTLWTTAHLTDNYELGGQFAYQSWFKHAIVLEGSNRLVEDEHKQWFEEFLAYLRDGRVTEEQWRKFISLTSEEAHIERLGSRQAYEDRFFGWDSTWYFTTNVEILRHNLKMLKTTNKPICRIDAIHNIPAAANGSEEDTKRLPLYLYLSVNSKIVLLWNLCVAFNLVNGTTGIVKDIIYAEGNTPPQLPTTIIVEIHAYNGPRIFSDVLDPTTGNVLQERSKWGFQSSPCALLGVNQVLELSMRELLTPLV